MELLANIVLFSLLAFCIRLFVIKLRAKVVVDDAKNLRHQATYKAIQNLEPGKRIHALYMYRNGVMEKDIEKELGLKLVK